MNQGSIILGLDVHKETIAVAVADRAGGEPRYQGTIANDATAVARLVRKFGPAEQIAACYEAGPCGYGLYRQLTPLGVECTVIAPSLVPTAPGERIKTDRRDALKLARLHRSGELTAVWVPDEAHEALRDLTRARDDARQDLQRARQRLSKFLLRPPAGMRPWTQKHRRWLDTLMLPLPAHQVVLSESLRTLTEAGHRLDRLTADIVDLMRNGPHAALWSALQTLRGVSTVTASTLVAELGDLSRFEHPRQLMAFAGLTPREHSSGARQQRGGITKTGNAQLRHGLIEAAWQYRHQAKLSGPLLVRQRDQPAPVTAIAWTAQTRLHRRYYRLLQRNKLKQQVVVAVVVVAVARELTGFIWEIAQAQRALATPGAEPPR